MNKKGEAFLILGILIIVIIGGMVLIKEKVDSKDKIGYVLNTMNKTYYNLKSNNPNCDINKIRIPAEHFKVVKDISNLEEFKIDEENPCD